MPLGREVDDVTGISARSCFEHEHLPWPNITPITGVGVGAEVLGERPLELERDTASHYSDAVHRVDQRFGVFRDNVADLEANHGDRTSINRTNPR